MKIIAVYEGEEMPIELKELANNGHTVYTTYKGKSVQLLPNNEATQIEKVALDEVIEKFVFEPAESKKNAENTPSNVTSATQSNGNIVRSKNSEEPTPEEVRECKALLNSLSGCPQLDKQNKKIEAIEAEIEVIKNALRKPIL